MGRLAGGDPMDKWPIGIGAIYELGAKLSARDRPNPGDVAASVAPAVSGFTAERWTEQI
jgi:hypothetical protein